MKLENKLWINKWSKEKYKPISETYNCSKYGTDGEPGASICMSSFARTMGKNFKEEIKLLDYGCGAARFCNFMSRRLKDFTYYGLEPNSEFGRDSIETAKKFFGHDSRINLGFIGSELEQEAIEKVDTVLLLSIFTHTTIEETNEILTKLLPIIQRGDKIVFSVLIAEKYDLFQGKAYTMENSYMTVRNTIQQIKEIQQKFNCKLKVKDTFSAQGGINVHQIYEMVK